MNNMKLLFLCLSLSFVLSNCSDDDPDIIDNTFENEFSFTIEGTDYDFDDFEVNLTWLDSQNRIFISKEDGDNEFTFNLPLDLAVGEHGMDWNMGGQFFFMDIPEGAFFTLDGDTNKLQVLEIDTTARRVSVTFNGVGSQAISSDVATFTNGVLKVNY